MQGRSWMAALTLAAGLAPASSLADTPAPQARPQTVKLELAIAGLGPNGCDVEVKPGHKGCSFTTKSAHVNKSGLATLVLRDVSTASADRDCTFAITIREPGQPERTVSRGLRLEARPTAAGQQMTCYLSSPSKLARAGGTERTKR